MGVSLRSRRLSTTIVFMVVMAGCAQGVEPTPEEAAIGAAQALCPVMWEWVKDVGAAFNEASGDMADIAEPDLRRSRWLSALDQMDQFNETLAGTIAAWSDDSVLGPIVAQIERDLPASSAEIDDVRALLAETPEVDEGPHQARTAQLIVRIEKIIELPKPDLAGLDSDGILIPAFREVPSCQHSIRDVDDGLPRANR